jgi:hypothetical protein
MGIRQYAADMSKVAATQPGGRERMSFAVLWKVPHNVGKSLEFISALTDMMEGLFLGIDMSWMSCSLDECGLGTSPSGDVWKGPIMDFKVSGVYASE